VASVTVCVGNIAMMHMTDKTVFPKERFCVGDSVPFVFSF